MTFKDRQIPELEEPQAELYRAAIELGSALNTNAWQQERNLPKTFSEEEIKRRKASFDRQQAIFMGACRLRGISMPEFTAEDVYRKAVK